MKKATTVAEYIKAAPKESRAKLREMRALIAAGAPGARQELKWGMPTFSYKRILVTFAAFKKHIGFFPPVRTADAKLKSELGRYEGPKGNLRFPLDEPIPYGLITKVVKCRVKEDQGQAKARKK